MVLAPSIDRDLFEVAPPRGRIEIRLFFEVKVPKKALIEALNDAARAKARLVDAGKMSSDQLARELEQVSRRYHIALTPDGYLALAERFNREAKFERAAKYYRMALEGEPDNVDVLVNLGAALGRGEKYKESVPVLRRALELKPTNVKALNNLAASLYRLGEVDEALRCLDGAMKLDPKYDTPYLIKGNILCERGDHSQAAKYFQAALDLPTSKPYAHVLLGFCLLEAGRPADAASAFQRGIEKGFRDPAMFLNLALAFGALGRKEEALTSLAQFDRDPRTKELLKDPALAEQLTRIHQELGGASKLSDLINALEIDLPQEINFADWEQLSTHLTSLRG